MILTEITIQQKYQVESEKGRTSLPFSQYRQICLADPTTKGENVGKYTNWLLSKISDPSDLERIKTPLEWYADGIKRGILQRSGISPDINHYRTIDELIQAVDSIKHGEDSSMMSQSEYNQRKKFEGQFRILGTSKYWELISPVTWECERWFGRKTEWCTVANEDYFHEYGGNEGALVIFYPKDGKLDERIQISKLGMAVGENGRTYFDESNCCDVKDYGYDTISDALSSSIENEDEDKIIDGVNLAMKVLGIKDEYIRLSTKLEYLKKGVSPGKLFNITAYAGCGFTLVMHRDKYNYVNGDGEVLSDEWFVEADQFSEGYAVVARSENEYNYIDEKGNFLSNMWFRKAFPFYDGFAIVTYGDELNFSCANLIDRNGNLLLNNSYKVIYPFSEGYAKVICNDGKLDYIDKTGRRLLNWDIQIADNRDFKNGRAIVAIEQNGKYLYTIIDRNGNRITDKWFAAIGNYDSNGYIIAKYDDEEPEDDLTTFNFSTDDIEDLNKFNILDYNGNPLFIRNLNIVFLSGNSKGHEYYDIYFIKKGSEISHEQVESAKLREFADYVNSQSSNQPEQSEEPSWSFQMNESQLEKIISENIRNILSEAALDSFSLEELSQIKSFKGRYQYCQKHLGKTFGRGSSRVVFEIDDEKVLKLALNNKGIAQNEAEADWYGQKTGVLVNTFHGSDYNTYKWLISENVLPAKPSDFVHIFGFDFRKFCQFIGSSFKFHYRYTTRSGYLPVTPLDRWEYEQLISEYETLEKIDDYIGSTNILIGDMIAITSWGMVLRNGQPTIVMLDGGFTEDTMKYYR